MTAETEQVQHTIPSRPWFLIDHPGAWTIQDREGGAGVAIAQSYGNYDRTWGEFIVRAVNSRDDLVEALNDALVDHSCDWNSCWHHNAREVLYKARGEE